MTLLVIYGLIIQEEVVRLDKTYLEHNIVYGKCHLPATGISGTGSQSVPSYGCISPLMVIASQQFFLINFFIMCSIFLLVI